ncbi:MAG: TolC family protein [Chitinophagaceae bacterium]|nr:TolC family protein [Chitinophagaceae bacterium]
MERLSKVLGFVLAVTASLPLLAQQKHELSIKEAVEMAYKNVIEIKNKELDYQIQEAQNMGIRGQALPQITGSAAGQYYYQLPIFLFPDATSTSVYEILKNEGVSGAAGPITNVPQPQLRPVSFQQPWNANAGATLTQLLFQPDVFVALKARSVSLEYARNNVELSKETVKDSAHKRYYAVLIAEKQLGFINDGVARIEKLVHDNEIMYQNGFLEKLDVDRAKVQLSNLKTTQTTLKNGIYLSYAALKFALGFPQKDSIVLKDTLSIDELKSGILSDEFKYDDRKEFQLLQTTKQLQLLDLKRYQLGYIPTVSLVGNYTRQGQANKFIFTDDEAFWYNTGYFGLNISIPIFDGLQRRYQVKQSKLKVQQVDNSIEYLKQGIDLEQTVSKESLKNSLLNFDEQQKNIELAEAVYNTTKKKFESGLGSSFDIIQAENDLQTSQSNYFQALYEAIVAKINYQKSVGKL